MLGDLRERKEAVITVALGDKAAHKPTVPMVLL